MVIKKITDSEKIFIKREKKEAREWMNKFWKI
jgi:hypothetical protein